MLANLGPASPNGMSDRAQISALAGAILASHVIGIGIACNKVMRARIVAMSAGRAIAVAPRRFKSCKMPSDAAMKAIGAITISVWTCTVPMANAEPNTTSAISTATTCTPQSPATREIDSNERCASTRSRRRRPRRGELRSWSFPSDTYELRSLFAQMREGRLCARKPIVDYPRSNLNRSHACNVCSSPLRFDLQLPATRFHSRQDTRAPVLDVDTVNRFRDKP